MGTFRVTNKILFGDTANNLARNLAKFNQIQTIVSTGKRVRTMSDDPPAASLSLRAKIQLAEIEQWNKNITDAQGWLGFTDTALDQAQSLMRSVRALAVQGANATQSSESRAALADQVQQITRQLAQIGNSQFGTRYIFSGQATMSPTFTVVGDPPTAVNYTTDPGSTSNVVYQTGPNEFPEIGVRGDEAFAGVFETLIQLATDLNNGDSTAISNQRLAEIDQQLTQISRYRAEAGSRAQALEQQVNRYAQASMDLLQVRSNAEDADLVAAINEMRLSENVYQASLLASARIFDISLVSFLR
jgi:flagellar hook-associated protein 3 FlgL